MEHQKSGKSLTFNGTDLEIRANVREGRMTIDVMKADKCVHRLTVDDDVPSMEHGWLAEYFAREDRVALSEIEHQAADYVSGLNINQG